MVVKVVNSDKEVWTDHENVTKDAKRILPVNSNWSIRYVYREANNIAHKLAKLAFDFSEERVWIEDDPLQISNSILSEKYCNND